MADEMNSGNEITPQKLKPSMESFIPGEEFGFSPRNSSSTTSYPEDFDVNFLSNRGHMEVNMNQWQRESLYQKFDPLASSESGSEFKRPPVPTPVHAHERSSHLPPIPPRSFNSTPPTAMKPGVIENPRIVPDSPNLMQSPSVKSCQKQNMMVTNATQTTTPQVQMDAKVLAEYENSMSALTQKFESMKEKVEVHELDKVKLIRERDQANEDLRNVESAFTDLHKRYERMKGILTNLKTNEDVLKSSHEQLELKLKNRDDKIATLKGELTSQLEKMHYENESTMNSTEMENQKLRALLRKADMKVQTLENDLEQKGKENIQLNNLCDELINGKTF